MNRIETLADGVTLYLGDCREMLPTLGNVDAVVTDPPYGVKFNYETWDDTLLVDWLPIARKVAPIVVFTPGIVNVWSFPKADWIYCWAKPGSTRRNGSGGFNCWEPILIYGKRRIWTDFAYLPDCANHAESGIGHPYPKPVRLFEILCEAFTDPLQLICDPFMGSGTTGIAAVKFGRRFVGIEIELKYFDIACHRISEALKQPDMFIEWPKVTEQIGFNL